ncbi:hypothetical protein CDL15_Pgr017218 [Punica granatum]|uniref:Uncharacterized protein n=1 Tax=Punica granatum TaxID=22663 RepID=A0A218WSZ8_PUNGR|nr:hypothetical protein CDL15_Pgr017218 [Punica granatum]PKI67801.1 hypothetical protein CRG98_011774 [Punica granatum]
MGLVSTVEASLVLPNDLPYDPHTVHEFGEGRIRAQSRRPYLPCPWSKLRVAKKVPANLPPGEGGWKLGQASLSEEAGGPWIEVWKSRWMEDFVEDSKI